MVPRYHPNIQQKATIWLSFVEIALFQHHDCISSPLPKWVVSIDESNLQTVYLILRCNKHIDHVLVFYIEPVSVGQRSIALLSE